MQIVDTNIVSELMRPTPDAGVRDWLDDMGRTGMKMAIPAICVDELVFGLTRRPRAVAFALFEKWVGQSVVLPIDQTIARRAGEMRALFSVRGLVRSQADMLIAATAQVHALTLVTRNVRDFDGCGIAVLNPFTE